MISSSNTTISRGSSDDPNCLNISGEMRELELGEFLVENAHVDTGIIYTSRGREYGEGWKDSERGDNERRGILHVDPFRITEHDEQGFPVGTRYTVHVLR